MFINVVKSNVDRGNFVSTYLSLPVAAASNQPKNNVETILEYFLGMMWMW